MLIGESWIHRLVDGRAGEEEESVMPEATLDGRSRSAALPRPIRRVLGRIRGRLWAAVLLRGVGLIALVGAVGAALGMLIDFATPLPQAGRWGLWGVWLAAVGATLGSGMLRTLIRGVGVFELAAVAERAHPQLGERLTGAVALVSPATATRVHGSPVLIAAVAERAAADVAMVDPARAVPLQRPARWCALGVVALGLIAAPAALWPASYGTLARRFLTPWANLDRIDRFVVSVTPGDGVAAIGSDLTLGARVRPRFEAVALAPPETAWLEWTEAGTGGQAEAGAGDWHRVAMPLAAVPSDTRAIPAPSRSFAVTLPRLTGSLLYRVRSGSAMSRTYRITAIEPPAVRAIAAMVEPPGYTRLPTVRVPDPNRIDAWEGSRVTLNVTASRPVQSIAVEWPAAAEDATAASTSTRTVAAALAADRSSGLATIAAEASGTYALVLRDAHGLRSRPEAPRRLVVRSDAAPVLAIVGSNSSQAESTSPGDVLTLGIAARDDLAVASVELHYAIERRSESSAAATDKIAIPLPGLGTRAARGTAKLALAPLDLRPGDTLTYRIRVADNRPAPRGPNVTWSPGRTLAIVAQAEPLLARRSQAERARLQAKLDALKQAAAANRRETEQLRYAADAVQRGNGQWEPTQQQALERREAEARGVADQLQLLARELAGETESSLRQLARPARQIAEVEAESSRAMLDQARRANDAAERLNDLRHADHRLAAVVQRLDDLQHQFDALARRDAELHRLRDLAGREEALAARVDGDAPTGPLQAEQKAVEKDLDALLKKSPELRSDILAAQAGEADTLAQKANALAERQRALARKTGDLAPKAETLRELAEAQRALELDARRLALEVDPPLAEIGRHRLNTTVVRDAIEPIEHGDLDQARQRLERAETELRRLARDLAALPAPADPKPGLTPAQAAAAEDLARRERLVREQLQTLLTDQVAPQQALRTEAVALGRDLTALRNRAQPLSDRARGPAQDAAQTIGEQAPRTMDQSSDRLAKGQAAAARELQRQAAALIERGAQHAEDLAAALRSGAGRRPDAPQTGAQDAQATQPPLAAARAAMRLASEQLAQAQDQAARQAMQQAARNLRAAAEPSTGSPDTGTDTGTAADAESAPVPAGDAGDPQETLARPGTPDLSELKAAIARTTGRAWGELPGHLRSEILQMSQGRYRDDYARLIQLYFREIAAGAGAGAGPGPDP
jgi:hypothetical protein